MPQRPTRRSPRSIRNKTRKVGAHAGHVAHVVAHVVGNRGGVSGIVFGNAVFHLADKIGTNVGRLGKDATADASKQSLATGAHAKAEHGDRDVDQAHGLAGDHAARPNTARANQMAMSSKP